MAKNRFINHFIFMIIAIIAGVLAGHLPSTTQIVNGVEQHIPGLGEQLKPLGDAFIRLIKMIIAPVIFLVQ
ncbi:cation:dicarboxylase symporter family transporter [Acinetobacter baumannii]